MRKEIVRKFVDRDGVECEMKLRLSLERHVSITAIGVVEERLSFFDIKDDAYYRHLVYLGDYDIKDGMYCFKTMRYGGCCHEKICEVFPEVERFIPLHLVEYDAEKGIACPFNRTNIPFDKLMTSDEKNKIEAVYERFRKRLGKQCREFIEFAESFSGDE